VPNLSRGLRGRPLADRDTTLRTGLERGLAAAGARPIVELAVEAASAGSEDERAWGLARLAAALRKAGELEFALTALDAAFALGPSDWAERALHTCAVAVHCDRNDPELAMTIGEEQMARSLDEKLLHAMARAYYEALEATGREEYRERWERISALLDAGRLPASNGRQLVR
jgi:tetratricopeptide (TPR) repeat protein